MIFTPFSSTVASPTVAMFRKGAAALGLVIVVAFLIVLLAACNRKESATEPTSEFVLNTPHPPPPLTFQGRWEPVQLIATYIMDGEWYSDTANRGPEEFWQARILTITGDLIFEHGFGGLDQGMATIQWSIKRLPDGRWLDRGIDTLTFFGSEDTLVMEQGVLDDEPERSRFNWKFQRYTGKFPPDRWNKRPPQAAPVDSTDSSTVAPAWPVD